MQNYLNLKCIECVQNEHRISLFDVLLKDDNNKKYFISIHDYIPLDTIIFLNTANHVFINNKSFIEIYVIQEYKDCQPTELNLMLINTYLLNDGVILTFKNINTNAILKQKVNINNMEIGHLITYNCSDLNLFVYSMPHYSDKYIIENWIFKNNVIEVL